MSMPAVTYPDSRSVDSRLRDLEKKVELTLHLMEWPYVCVAHSFDGNKFDDKHWYGVSKNIETRGSEAYEMALKNCEDGSKKIKNSVCGATCHENALLILMLKNLKNNKRGFERDL